MKIVTEMVLCVMVYISSFTKTGSGNQQLIHRHAERMEIA